MSQNSGTAYLTVTKLVLFSRPGQSYGLLYKQLRNSFIDLFIHLVILFLPQLYGAALPKWFEIAFPVIKQTMS